MIQFTLPVPFVLSRGKQKGSSSFPHYQEPCGQESFLLKPEHCAVLPWAEDGATCAPQCLPSRQNSPMDAKAMSLRVALFQPGCCSSQVPALAVCFKAIHIKPTENSTRGPYQPASDEVHIPWLLRSVATCATGSATCSAHAQVPPETCSSPWSPMAWPCRGWNHCSRMWVPVLEQARPQVEAGGVDN